MQTVLLKQAGVVGFTNANKPIYNPLLMKRILSYSTMLDLPVIQHADIPELSMDTEATESENSTRLGLRGVPSITEAMLIERDLHLVKLTNSRFHVSHVSTKEGLKAIERGSTKGIGSMIPKEYYGYNRGKGGEFTPIPSPLRMDDIIASERPIDKK